MLQLLPAQSPREERPAPWRLSIPKAQVVCRFLNRQDDFEPFGGSSGCCGSQTHACPSRAWLGHPCAHGAAVPYPTLLLQVPWRGLSLSSSLSETSPVSNLLAWSPKAITWLFALHSFQSFKSLPPVTARHPALDLESRAFSTFTVVNAFKGL